jgi:sodium-dependent dicarboxylate transporter 2/3/5
MDVTPDPIPDSEPLPPSRAKLLVIVPLALVAAFLGAWLAPADWESGSGRVSLSYHGAVFIDAELPIGEDHRLSYSGMSAATSVDLTFSGGVPTDAPVRAMVRVTEGDTALRPDFDQVELTLTLPDSRQELVPIVRWDDATQQLEGIRRPTRSSAVVLGLLGLVVVMWVSEVVPLFVTSLLIPVVLVFSGLATATDATAPFFNPIIVLFFAGFLMAESMRRTGLDRHISMAMISGAGRSAGILFGSMIGLAAFLSMWMSNTAATAVLVPIALAVSAPIGHAGFRRALVLGIAYASTIGGVGSAIGTPANQLAIEFLGEFGNRSISFVEWFAFGVPMVVIFLPLMGWYLWRRSGVRLEPGALARARQVAHEERVRLGRMDRDQLTVLAVFAAVAVGWLTQTFHGVHPGLVALAGAVALFVLRKLQPEDLGRISWSALLTFGGGLTLGLFLVETGTSDYIATRLAGLAAVPATVAVIAVASITLLLTTVASNTASAAILIPLAIPLAGVLGVDVTTLVIVVAIASSIDFALVIGTPPTMIAYSTKLYTAGQIFRRGAVLDLVGIALLVLVITRVWSFLGLT